MARAERLSADPNDPNTVEYDLTEHRKFVYDGERLLLELVVDPNDPNDPDSDTVAMKYTWGLDLLSQFSGGATVRGSGGGIGALLAVWDADDPNGYHAVLHDANGNVVEVLSPATDPNDPNTAIVAHYEYDVYGNRTNPLDPNDTEFEQPFGYASKWRDPDTGLVDFGRRWYFADHGRWLNRDPIGVRGGLNIYAYAMNDPANQIDPLGLLLPCPDYLACAPTEHSFDWCPSDTGGGGGGGPAPSSPGPRPQQPSEPPDTKPPTTTQPDIPDCSGSSPCWLACTLGEAMGAAVCNFPKKPGEPGYACTCDCFKVFKIRGIDNPFPIGNAKADELIRRCIREEEKVHARNLDCSNFPDELPKDKNPEETQCPGDIAQLKCLAQAISECGRDAECRRELKNQAKMNRDQCMEYGPNNTSKSDKYKMPCSDEEKVNCQKAYEEFLEKFKS